MTGNDLMNIDFLLGEMACVVNQPQTRKKLIDELRMKIHLEMNKIKINIKK